MSREKLFLAAQFKEEKGKKKKRDKGDWVKSEYLVLGETTINEHKVFKLVPFPEGLWDEALRDSPAAPGKFPG